MVIDGARRGPPAYGEIAFPPIFGNPIVYLRSSLDTNQCQLFPKIVGGSPKPSLIRRNCGPFATLPRLSASKNARSTVRLEGMSRSVLQTKKTKGTSLQEISGSTDPVQPAQVIRSTLGSVQLCSSPAPFFRPRVCDDARFVTTRRIVPGQTGISRSELSEWVRRQLSDNRGQKRSLELHRAVHRLGNHREPRHSHHHMIHRHHRSLGNQHRIRNHEAGSSRTASTSAAGCRKT